MTTLLYALALRSDNVQNMNRSATKKSSSKKRTTTSADSLRVKGWTCEVCGSHRNDKESIVECRECLAKFGKCCSTHGDDHDNLIRGLCVPCRDSGRAGDRSD